MKYWLILFVGLSLNALDISIQSGKESSSPYSVLHLRELHPFECHEVRNDFNEVTQVECAISNIKTLPIINNPHFTFSQTPTSLIIKAKTKIALFPIDFNLLTAPCVYKSPLKPVKHWTIIGYKGKLPIIGEKKSNPNALNIPIVLTHKSYPFVGGLDLSGKPIKMKNVQDVNDFMELKKAYAMKDYRKVNYLASDILKNHPNTIFANELALYQLRAYHHRGEFEKVLELSKPFLRKFSSDPNVAEVLVYTANAYAQLGQISDSDYFYDRLFSEHIDDPFAQVGMYLKAKHLEVIGSSKKASKYYREALSRTKDVELASACAFNLAQFELGGEEPKKANDYIDKIAKVNPDYFGEVRPEALAMIEILIGKKEYRTAAKITQALIGTVPYKSQSHESYLKNLGLFYEQAGDRTKALGKYNEYIKLFPYGEFITQVKRSKDGLFFDNEEPTGTTGEKKYNELIERYGDDSIGRTALYKKAQLLYKEGNYDEVLKMDNELYKLDSTAYPDANGLVTKSAAALAQKRLQEGKCSQALSLLKMYKLTLASQWDGLSFECSLKEGNFPVAQELLKKNSKQKDMASRQMWLYRTVKLNFVQGYYKKANLAGNDLVTLLESYKNPPLNDVVRTLFDASQRSGDEIGMIKNIKGCETLFGTDFKDIERYSAMVTLGVKRKDEAMVQSYAAKVMNLQKRTSTYTQSPFVEFTLAQSTMNQDKNKEALEALKSLDARKLTPEKRSRQKYLIGSLLMKMKRNNEAKIAFNESIKADKKSAWGKLASDALGLL